MLHYFYNVVNYILFCCTPYFMTACGYNDQKISIFLFFIITIDKIKELIYDNYNV